MKNFQKFLQILDHNASLKEKQVRDNHAPFMTKELSKVIMEKLNTRNKYLKWPSRENYVQSDRVITGQLK